MNLRFMVSEPYPGSEIKPHKLKTAFSSTITEFFTDNTLQKAILLKEKQQLEMQQLSIKHSLLEHQITVRNTSIAQRRLQEHWESLIQAKIVNYKSSKSLENRSAIIIQKFVRGFLARLHTEQTFLSHYENKALNLILASSHQALTIMLNLGVILVPATIMIQKSYKRYRIRLKLYYLRLCYEQHLLQKAEKAAETIRSSIVFFLNIDLLKARKFYITRGIRLIQIRENLAILRVKSFWRSKRLSFKILKEKILRIKRRQAALQNKEAYAKYLNSIGGKLEKRLTGKLSIGSEIERITDPDNPEEIANDTIDEEEFLEAQRIKDLIQKKIKDKIEKGKVSYGVKDSRNVMVLPLMQEKALNESPSEETRLMNLTASVFAKGRSLKRGRKVVSRATLISSPACCEHKRLWNDANLPYMRAMHTPEPEFRMISPLRNIDYAEFMASTVSSAKKRYKTPQVREGQKQGLRIPPGSNLVTQTLSYSLKLQPKISERKTRNLNFSVAKEKYVPSINNASYSPTPWKPLPLHKEILIHSEYSRLNREKLSYKSNVVDFTNRILTPDLPRIHQKSAISASSAKDMPFT